MEECFGQVSHEVYLDDGQVEILPFFSSPGLQYMRETRRYMARKEVIPFSPTNVFSLIHSDAQLVTVNKIHIQYMAFELSSPKI